jgi:transposase
VRNHAKVKSRAKARNLAEAKRVSRKNHAAANTDPIIRKAAASHIAAIDLNDLITINAAALAKDVERKSIIPTAEEMLIANGTKGTCGSIAATAKHQIIFFETLFKREYDKKGFFLFHREIK